MILIFNTLIKITLCKPKEESECPVCYRVMRATKDLSLKNNIPATSALDSYCEIQSLDTDDSKFCYNTANIRKELFRLIELGADEYRICQKVKSINSDFCKIKSQKLTNTGIHLNERLKKGIIYE